MEHCTYVATFMLFANYNGMLDINAFVVILKHIKKEFSVRLLCSQGMTLVIFIKQIGKMLNYILSLLWWINGNYKSQHSDTYDGIYNSHQNDPNSCKYIFCE